MKRFAWTPITCRPTSLELAHGEHKKEYDQALADCDQAVRLNPKHSRAYYGRGVTWSKKSDYAKAIADYSKAIELDPKYAAAFSARGMAHRRIGELDKS